LVHVGLPILGFGGGQAWSFLRCLLVGTMAVSAIVHVAAGWIPQFSSV
jgi:hypothetical protein